jgi:hypothetical protein
MVAKIPFSDVTPPEKKRSIRNVPIPVGGKRKVPLNVVPPKEPVVSEEEDSSRPNLVTINKQDTKTEEKRGSAYEYYYPQKEEASSQYSSPRVKSKKKFFFGVTALIIIVIFIVGMMTVFASATIDITPKSQEFDAEIGIVATNDPGQGEVRYEIIKLSNTKTISVPATGEEPAEIKASGKIVVYNNFSAEPQRLIVRTRFESPEGLIYRIPESIVVPGKTSSGPGSMETVVYADEAGEKYNIKKTDFTIPGFKNDANRYKNFYAKSATEMAGGFVGKMKTVLQADKQKALQDLDNELQTILEKELNSKIPAGLTLIPGSISYKSTELPQKDSGSSVEFGKEMSAYAVMLNTEDLSNTIVNKYASSSPAWTGINSIVNDFTSLKVTKIAGDIEKGGKLEIEINGKVKIWADIDLNIINQRLLGAPKGDAGKLIDEFTGISSVKASVKPVWKRSFPDNPAKIHVRAIKNQ